MKAISKEIAKLDSQAILSGAPVYTQDLAPGDCLIIKVLRSPYASAKIHCIDTTAASRINGIICILTHDDVPKVRYTAAGAQYPEDSPYDRYILENVVRYVGDPVAIIAGESQEAVARALRLIKVDYEVLTPLLDFEHAKGNPIVVHRENDFHTVTDIGSKHDKNVAGSYFYSFGDVNSEFAKCDCIIKDTYYTKANSHAMMETFRSFAYYDDIHRLTVVASTQITFHCQRAIARVLGLPQSQVRVIKPRVGGGFGSKQSLVTELITALVTLKTGRPSMLIYDRNESFVASNTRHQTRLTVKMGATNDGVVKAMSIDVCSNAGAYAEHAYSTSFLAGHRSLPLYNKAEGLSIRSEALYTNTEPGGAFRGFGVTQGCFAVESTANHMAQLLHIDPVEFRLKNIPAEGDILPAYFGERLSSCALDRCILRGREMIGWNEKYPSRRIDAFHTRAVGMAITMQGSGVANCDVCSVIIQLNGNCTYSLSIGASDIGTGCDTALAQIAAEVLGCDVSLINVDGVDTSSSPYDKGSYASSTTYVTGMAVVKACNELVKLIKNTGAQIMGLELSNVEFDSGVVYAPSRANKISLKEIAAKVAPKMLSVHASHTSPVSPPPFMAGFAEIELDHGTGQVKVIDYVGVVDCGTLINPQLAAVQAEGGIVQGIGMALFEDVLTDKDGKLLNGSFLQYRIPSRMDVPCMRIAFESSYEPTGPFGAKSIGEVVINTPCPAIVDAIYNATGIRFYELPVTAEKIKLAMNANAKD